MLLSLKPKLETFARVFLTIIVILNVTIPTAASAMSLDPEDSTAQVDTSQNIFAQSSMSGKATSEVNELTPEVIKADVAANQIATSSLTPTPVFSPTPEAKQGIQFDLLASPTQASPGEVVEFTIVIKNNEKNEITGLSFSNFLPDQLTNPKSKSKDLQFDAKEKVLTWEQATAILTGETITLEYTATIDSQINTDILLIDEADLFVEGKGSSLIATSELAVFTVGENQEFTGLGTQGGEAESVDGNISVNVPAGQLSETEGILIKDISETFQSDTTELLLVFQLDVVSQKKKSMTPTLPSGTTAATSTAPSTLEPTSTPTLSQAQLPTITPTPTLRASATNNSDLVSETPDQETPVAPIASEPANLSVSQSTIIENASNQDLSQIQTPTITPTITPTPTVEPSIESTLDQEPSSTHVIEATSESDISLTPTTISTVTPSTTSIVLPTVTATLEHQEEDAVVSLEIQEAKFEKPVTLTVSFDGLANLSTLDPDKTPFIVTLDENSDTWVRIPVIEINRKENTITAEITHFSMWGAGIGPAFPGGNVLLFDTAYPDIFTGNSKYSIPIWTPPGRHGMEPSLALSYSGGKINGILADVQSSWVGLGWNIDTVEIARLITSTGYPESYGYQNKFILLFNGTGYELIADGTTGRYRTKSESFLYIQLHNDSLGNNSPAATNATGEWWEVVETDGTRWRLGWTSGSEQLAAMKGYPGAATGAWTSLGYAGHANNVVAFRWRADQTTDTFSNRMTTTYFEETRLVATTSTYYDRASYLNTISYTEHTSGSPAPGYSVVFVRETRNGDEVPTMPYDMDNWDTYRLDYIQVKYGANVIRTYNLALSVRYYSEIVSWQTTVLDTLAVSGGSTVAPTTTFSYTDLVNYASDANCGLGCEHWKHPRLSSITNGQGGTTTFTYDNDGRSYPKSLNWRVQAVEIADSVSSGPMKTIFAYSGPCYVDPSVGWCNGTNVGELIGYSQTTVTTKDFNGTTSLAVAVHKFYTDPAKAGREYQIQNQDGSGTILSQTDITVNVTGSGFPVGVFFVYVNAVEQYLRTSTLVRVSKSEYAYDNATGNLIQEKHYDGTPTLYRQINYEYLSNFNTSVWILSALFRRTLKDSGGVTKAVQEYGYDNNLPGVAPLTQGALKLSRVVDGTQTIDTEYFYDTYGNIITTWNYKGYGITGSMPSGTRIIHSQGYDPTLKTYVVSSTTPIIPSTSIGYDYGLGLPTSTTDANGNTTTTAYDGLGRVTQITYPGQAQPNVKYTYPVPPASPPSLAVKMEIWDQTASVYRSAWQIMDGLGRVIQTQSPYETVGNLVLSNTSYNAQGLVHYQGIPTTVGGSGGSHFSPIWGSLSHTTSNYDALGRVTSIVYPDSSTETNSYSGLSTTRIDRNNHQKIQKTDAFGRVVTVEEYIGAGAYTLYATTAYTFDVRDQLTAVTDNEVGTQTTISYNGFGRKTAMSDPNMGSWSYVYDAIGNITNQTDARSCMIALNYDDLNRPTSKSYFGPGACDSTPDVTFTYDSTANGNEGYGHRTGMSDANSSISWMYNVLGQTTKETRNIESTDYVTSFTYDAFNRPLTQTLPNLSAEVLNYSYNAMGALSSLTGSSTYVSQIHYAASGQVSDQLFGNGLIQQNCYEANTLRKSNIRVYSGSLQSCSTSVSTPRLNLSYTYQANGNVSQIIDATRAETLSYSYDDLDRLLNVNGPYNQNYSYGTTGNLITKSNATIAPPNIAFTTVTSGFDHSCGLTVGGAVKCWGSNGNGQLGDGTTTSRFTPVAVSGLSSGVIAIEAGGFYTCALMNTGMMKCWGQNNQGQLGDGTQTQSSTPVNVSGLGSGVVAISAGYQTTCALMNTGGVKCWGNNSDGAVGDGTATTPRLTPVNVSGLASGVNAIASGIRHNCALTTTGGVKCWGLNANGQLGDGTIVAKTSPVNVTGLLSGVTAISAGETHSCALTSSGGMKCWGGNSEGQLGNNSTTQSLTAVDVSGLLSGVAALSVGNFHTCARTTTGVMKCWGRNSWGQLGDGTIVQRNTAVNVGGSISGLSIMAPGLSHTCALMANGRIKCWGENNTFGRLGDGTTVQRTTPMDVNWSTNGSSPVEAGGFHTCALDGVGGVKCWGLNANGQLGDNSTTTRNIPVVVSGLTSGVTALAPGIEHTCALTAVGGVKCWGQNSNGQLGDGSTSQRLIPVDVSGLTSGVIAITSGTRHTCALTTLGGVKCWGQNTQGQLGNGNTIQALVPVNVSGLPSGVIAISAGDIHTCALMATGGVKCWGSNSVGQLGDGTTISHITPADVSGLPSGVSAISSGNFHNCVLTTAGGIKCWGRNNYGQLGDGSLIDRTTPVNVSGFSNGATAITSGSEHSCTKTQSGGMKCWGANSNGKLGDGTTSDRSTPVDVVGLTSGVLAITSTYYHSCALTIGGEKCWGYNLSGQVGDGTYTQRLTSASVIINSAIAAYTYGDTTHKHAVTALSSGETYAYDATGNMIQRVEGGLTYTQTFDAENRLISVTVGVQTTQFIYDGGGNLIKKIKPDGSKTLYVGGVYEIDKNSGGTVTRRVTYYPAGGAMRIDSTLYHIVGDHLHSSTITTNNLGTIVGEQRYYPYGETRPVSGSMFTDKLFTSQREMAGLGIYNYGARFYSPRLGRFLNADTIVPSSSNPQALNRYSYVLNNPILYIDPTGHRNCIEDGYNCPGDKGPFLTRAQTFKAYGVVTVGSWTRQQENYLLAGLRQTASALGKEMQKDPFVTFRETYGITENDPFRFVMGSCDPRGGGGGCGGKGGNKAGAYTWGSREVEFYFGAPFYGVGPNRSGSEAYGMNVHTVVHELGHAFSSRFKSGSSSHPYTMIDVAKFGDQSTYKSDQGFRLSPDPVSASGYWRANSSVEANETFANMYVGWVYNAWRDDTYGTQRRDFMNTNMTDTWLPILTGK